MRFTTYLRKILGTGEVQALPFGEEHFREAGVGYAPVAGMPLLESYQLVNKWNRLQPEQPRYLYFLEQ